MTTTVNNTPAATTATEAVAYTLAGKGLFTVTKCTESSNGGYVTTIQNKGDIEVPTAFGVAYQSKQLTFYMKLKEAAALGMEAELDLSKFTVNNRPYVIPSGEKAGETIDLKWLSPKI